MANFYFRREASYILFTVYIPLIMLITIAWFTFWIDPNGVNNITRTILVVACLFYASYFSAKINEKIPKAAYTKAIDVWTGVKYRIKYFLLMRYMDKRKITFFTRYLSIINNIN